MKYIKILIVTLLPFGALAAETTGSAELGYLARSGNTDSTDLNAKFAVARMYEQWTHSLALSAELAEENNSTTTQRYQVGVKSEYRLSAVDYLFGTVDYQNDKFGAYDSRWSEAIGYGRRLFAQETQTLDLEVGAGARQSKLSDGTTENEAIARFGLNYWYKFATGAEFTNKFLTELGEENTYLENVAAVGMPLFENISLKTSYTVRHNTDVPAGTEKTDTVTSVNLSYKF